MILAILQARMSSRRLPGKVLSPVFGAPMLARQVERVSRAKRIDKLVVATSAEASDDPIEALCGQLGVICYRGSLDDVLGRFAGAARTHGPADHIVRLTADCPLADWDVIDDCVALHLKAGADYTSNIIERSYPDGLDVEVMKRATLERADAEAPAGDAREHVTPYIYCSPDRFSIVHMVQGEDQAAMRWTVDGPADLDMTCAVYEALYPANPAFNRFDVLAFLQANRRVVEMNHALG